MATRILVDANVLFSRTLRDWLFLLKLESGGEMFTVASTIDIIAETVARYRDKFPEASGRTITLLHDRISNNIDERVDDFTIDGSFPGSDQGDSHVHAAVVACGADKLLTCDKGWAGLTEEQLAELPYEPYDPDDFFCLVDDSSPETVRSVVAKQRDYFLCKDGEVDLPEKLRAAGCPEFARRVAMHLQTMPMPAAPILKSS